MKRPQILIADDDIDILESYEFLLKDEYDVVTAPSVALAKKVLKERKIEAAIIDLNFEGQEDDGLALFDFIEREKPECGTLVFSSDTNTKRVVAASKRNNIDFIVKDETSEAQIRSALRQFFISRTTLPTSDFEFRTNSSFMKEILRDVDKIASQKRLSSILILGESGTGKDHLAQYIASRMNKKLVATNMAAIPKDMAESELFGHKKGSFTGALTDKKGLIEEADGGIFFLDEIGDCPLAIQAKLLRVIQNKEIVRVGENTPRPLDVQFVAATHKVLDKLVDSGEFRLDLFERLNVFSFTMPSLRERPEDIELYTRLFVKELQGDRFFYIDQEVIDLFMKLPWKRNVRELKNTIERAITYSTSQRLDKELLLKCLEQGAVEPVLEEKMFTFEQIVKVLKEANGNRTKAAKMLGIHRSTFLRWIRKFDLENMIEVPIGRPSALRA